MASQPVEETSERTPLLPDTTAATTSRVQHATDGETPLPKGQILLLSFTRIAEPLTFAILFPFVNAMVLRTGEVEVEEVGYYVGAIESLFSLVQMMFLISWGWAADKYGRKPVLLISLLGAALSTTLFGFSTKIWHMFVARCIGGLFGGNAVVVRTLFAEISDSTNQARAFSFFAFASNIGLMVGPLIGGAFAEPEDAWPGTFGRIGFLRTYPYALPCLVSGSYCLLAFALNAVFLREPAKREHDPKKDGPKPGLRTLLTPPVLKALLVFSAAMFLGLAYTAVLPIWLFTPVHLGGLNFPPSQIAVLIALAGFSQSLWLLLAMPPLDKALGTYRLLRICFTFWPWFLLTPIAVSLMARAGDWVVVFILVGLMHTLGSGVAMAFTSVQLLLNNVSPPAHLGAINGLALTINSGIRTFTPALFASIFAVGVQKNILGRYLAWVVLWACGMIGYFVSMLAPRENVRVTGVGEPESEPLADEEQVAGAEVTGATASNGSPASTTTLIESDNAR
ncbi:MFS general substrate transporter [Punctularia strigosozonata HHB-11173 SS5]|uniref:MFS general substrate transporter n=1 Tax=Punctularia strigosozonata (strain HHB-11173) TaxID=741275 RepID=UPI000441727E|nr:MFS general substrate transporter [Punctularia strigosozonata HHB-11173 SS5]EIN12458.1 MFS general substrate transporter [Punctularia strigosozonata HHB-11173 SS5]